jgi:hypothetical protein
VHSETGAIAHSVIMTTDKNDNMVLEHEVLEHEVLEHEVLEHLEASPRYTFVPSHENHVLLRAKTAVCIKRSLDLQCFPPHSCARNLLSFAKG